MKTSIIILTFNKLEYTQLCIESIRDFTRKGTYEIIVIDNGSSDGTVDWLKKQTDIRSIFNKENLGFPKGCNQGIEIAVGDNILLLNNDVIVTYNWLENLIEGLYSSVDVGAVGPVTNSAAYYTAIETPYDSLEEMHVFAEKYNKSCSFVWKERLKLIGFCLLIKREALNKVGLLDEVFTPGNFEDDDYSVRLRRNGYKLLLCQDTFIHHFGSTSWKENLYHYSDLLSENEKKFRGKWGTTQKSYEIHMDLLELVETSINEPLNVLHIGCLAGGTLLELKSNNKNMNLYGIEPRAAEFEEARLFVNVKKSYDLMSFDANFFDVIIYTDYSTTITKELLESISYHLKDDGKFISKLPNIGYHRIIQTLLEGKNPFSNSHVDYYSFSQLQLLFKESSLNVQISGIRANMNEQDQEFIISLQNLFGEHLDGMLVSDCFIINGTKNDSNKHEILSAILTSNNEIVVRDKLELLNKLSLNEVTSMIMGKFDNDIEKLHLLAMKNFAFGYYDYVLPYLEAALEKDSVNKDTLFNLGYILNIYGEKQLALRYLQQIDEKDDEVINLLNALIGSEEKRKKELTFLLRRVEFEISTQDSLMYLINKMEEGYFGEDEIIETIRNGIINKVKILQTISIWCFEHEMHEYVLLFLKEAYKLDSNNNDTLYNLGYVLLSYGENQLAQTYLEKINNKDENVLELLTITRGDNHYE